MPRNGEEGSASVSEGIDTQASVLRSHMAERAGEWRRHEEEATCNYQQCKPKKGNPPPPPAPLPPPTCASVPCHLLPSEILFPLEWDSYPASTTGGHLPEKPMSDLVTKSSGINGKHQRGLLNVADTIDISSSCYNHQRLPWTWAMKWRERQLMIWFIWA